MAVLERLPEQSIIDGLRGALDFYVYRGIPCVRSWPRNKHAGFTPGALINQPRLARSARLKPFLSASLAVASERYRLGSPFTNGDVHTAAYWGKLRANDDPLPGPT